ncbi:MAG: type 1 glutamine amidotransferase [Desulfobacterales bacterium]
MDRILFLDNSIDEDVYQPLTYWEALLLFPFDFFRVSAGQWPDGLDAYSHVLITGSTASVLDDTAWMQKETALIRDAVNNGKVILGSCFGHQIIARSLFGRDAVRRRQKPEIGWPQIQILARDALLGEPGRTLNGFVFHFDEVCHVPAEKATIVARSADCEILAFKLKDHPVWGIQPHFEMGIVEGIQIIDRAAGDQIPDKRHFFRSDEHRPRDSGWIIPLMKAFHETRPI